MNAFGVVSSLLQAQLSLEKGKTRLTWMRSRSSLQNFLYSESTALPYA